MEHNTQRYFREMMRTLEIVFHKLFIRKHDETVIPYGHYCYLPDTEKNAVKDENDHSYYIKTCPYYRYFHQQSKGGCTFVGFVGWEPGLGDQCKICGKNED